mgnify:CR=1 FL=1
MTFFIDLDPTLPFVICSSVDEFSTSNIINPAGVPRDLVHYLEVLYEHMSLLNENLCCPYFKKILNSLGILPRDGSEYTKTKRNESFIDFDLAISVAEQREIREC